MSHRLLPLLLLPALALPAATAAAQSSARAAACAGQVADLAERYGIDPAVPAGIGEADPEISAGDLQRSGGVISPPVVGDMPVLEPEVTPPMPTTPPMGTGDPGRPEGEDAAMQHQAESLLGTAMAAAAEGDAALCMDRLEEARALLGSPMPGAVTPPRGGGLGRDRDRGPTDTPPTAPPPTAPTAPRQGT